MGRFYIEKINIEKSARDIKTGVVYKLIPEFNIIYGKNEAGKTSLMKFIKDSIFQLPDTGKGKIFFCTEKNGINSVYRADINDKEKKKDRSIISVSNTQL
ncbi:MAG: AAA family ATPase, partial [Candidatus Gastranaerophilales bacterium]|nr:AAA family ATPase [Candidatus Gastranaerophilales bacterium]